MKHIKAVGLVAFFCSGFLTFAGEDFDQDLKWRARFDIGGSIPEETAINEFGGPVSGEKLKLSPGVQFDIAVTHRFTPWLEVGPELGFDFNSIDSFGGFSYRDTSLMQMPIMADVIFEYPYAGRLAPYVGAGIGGVASFMTFGSNGYWEPDGTGSDFVLGFQAFAGLRYRFNNKFSMGVGYRFLMTDEQNWNIEWWTGRHFNVGVDSMRSHQISLVFAGTF